MKQNPLRTFFSRESYGDLYYASCGLQLSPKGASGEVLNTHRARFASLSFNISFSLSCGNDKDSSGSKPFPLLM